MVTRRKLLLGSAGAAAALALGKPSDKGGDYSPYFSEMNSTLKKAGIGSPVLVIDLDRLGRNIDRIVESVNQGEG